jgi:hypothetical protein
MHFGVCQAVAAQHLSGGADAALADFITRIEAYARLHQRLETRFPPLEATTDPVSRLLNRRYLAAAIRGARPNAKEGDIFTPDVTEILRARLAEAMAGRDIGVGSAGDEGWPAAVVNEPFAEEASRAVPPLLLQALPPLPGGIEYRQLGADLVLWDIHADIVIDVLVDAFRPLSDLIRRAMPSWRRNTQSRSSLQSTITTSHRGTGTARTIRSASQCLGASVRRDRERKCDTVQTLRWPRPCFERVHRNVDVGNRPHFIGTSRDGVEISTAAA